MLSRFWRPLLLTLIASLTFLDLSKFASYLSAILLSDLRGSARTAIVDATGQATGTFGR